MEKFYVEMDKVTWEEFEHWKELNLNKYKYPDDKIAIVLNYDSNWYNFHYLKLLTKDEVIEAMKTDMANTIEDRNKYRKLYYELTERLSDLSNNKWIRFHGIKV